MKIANPFPNSDSNKRYFTYDYFLRRKFGRKCAKISLDAGLSCPNIDGRKGRGGCDYCSGRFVIPALPSLSEQFEAQKAVMTRKWGENAAFIPYLQAHTNTYAPTARLREIYEEALSLPGIVGLNIATRADCLSDSTVRLLREIGGRTYLTVELGLQTTNDATAERINRRHSYADFLRGYEKLEGLNVCVHIINGLPGEDRETMLKTARDVAELHPAGVKLHLLHILRGTALAEAYAAGSFDAMTLEAYVDVTVDQLELFPPDVYIGRVTGDGVKDELIAPLWSLKKFVVMNSIDREFVRRGSWQGIYYK